MELTRRNLLTASTLLFAAPKAAFSAATATLVPAPPIVGPPSAAKPIVLCWNENPYGPSPAARAVIGRTIGEACRYPDLEIADLVNALARHEGVAADRIVTGSGSGELLCALGLIYGQNGGEFVAAEPTYGELPAYAKHAGAELTYVPVDDQLRHDLKAMRATVSGKTRAVYICNPNNPTGTTVSADALRAFVESLPDRVTTIVDEAYLDFADSPDVRSATDLVAEGKRVVVLRTFSKIHGMAGARCGYAIASPQIVADLAATRMTTPNIFAVRAARVSLDDRAFLAETRTRIIASRTRVTGEMSRLGLHFAKPQGNFVFFDTGGPLTRFTEFMHARNILVGRLFPPYDHWCRITIGTEPEVDAFLAGLRSYSGQRAAAA